MKIAELELVIKRLDLYFDFNKEQIRDWLFKAHFSYTNCTPIDYLNFNMGYIIMEKIDQLKLNKELYK